MKKILIFILLMGLAVAGYSEKDTKKDADFYFKQGQANMSLEKYRKAVIPALSRDLSLNKN